MRKRSEELWQRQSENTVARRSKRGEVGASSTTTSEEVDERGRDEQSDRQSNGGLDELFGDGETRTVGSRLGVGVRAGRLGCELEQSSVRETGRQLEQDTGDHDDECGPSGKLGVDSSQDTDNEGPNGGGNVGSIAEEVASREIVAGELSR